MTIFGSDVSHYDAPDTRAMFADGIVFQTHKAGGDSNDTELGNWWNYARPSRPNVLLGAYWVLYPGNPAGRADAFLARLDSQCPGWRDGPFILQVDCEKWNSDASTVPPVSDINAFCDQLVARVPKLRPIGYLPDWVYGDISKFKYPLWSSKYVTGAGGYKALYPGDGARQWAPYGGRYPDVLQYSSSATIGGQTTCDANAFRGTLDQLIQLLAPGWAKENSMSGTQDVVDGNAQYNKVTTGADATYPNGGPYNQNASGRNVWDWQDVPNPLEGKKGPAWQAIRALHNDAIAKDEVLAELTAKVDHLTGLLEAHIAGVIESKPNG